MEPECGNINIIEMVKMNEITCFALINLENDSIYYLHGSLCAHENNRSSRCHMQPGCARFLRIYHLFMFFHSSYV